MAEVARPAVSVRRAPMYVASKALVRVVRGQGAGMHARAAMCVLLVPCRCARGDLATNPATHPTRAAAAAAAASCPQ